VEGVQKERIIARGEIFSEIKIPEIPRLEGGGVKRAARAPSRI